MQIVVHDNKMRKVALLNNRFSKMLSFHNDAWHRYLIQATSTFDFSIPKMYNGRLHEDLGFINDKAYFSFKFQGKHHLFYVANITEDDFNITLNCNNTNLELVNEQANPFTSNSAQTIEWYLQRMELLLFANLEIGVNEIADSKRTLTFESQESKLSRLQSLMSRFDAEFEFVTELNNNGTLKRIVLNIYREADSEHHGIGKVRNDVVLRYGKDVKGVQVTTDKTQLFNAGEFTGADGLTLKDIERSDKDAKGREEFYTRKGNTMIYAPISMESYPASMKSGDNWTRKDFQTEYTNVNDLAAYAFRTIKQYAYPIVTYTASVQSNFLNDYQDLVLGDTVKIYDKIFVGGLILQARVTEQVISFSNPSNNTLTFSNYVKLDSKISDTLRKRMAELIEEHLPYTLKMSASTGTSFKNGTGESIVTPELYKGQKKITDATYRYYFGSEMTTGQTYKVLASGIENKQVLTVAAYIGNDEVTRDELTFVNVNDGAKGDPGKSITITKTERQADGVKVTFSDNKSIVVPKGDKGEPADPKELNQLKQEMNQARQGLDDVKADLLREKSESSAKIDQVKQDVGAIRNQQTTYEQTNTQNLARITGQLGDKASKSEVKQTADGIREEISHLNTASRNYILNSDMTTATDRTTGTGLPLSSDLIRTLNAERSFTLSVDVIAQNMVAKNDKKRFGISYELKFSDGSNLWTEVFQTSDTALARISKNFVLPVGKQIVSIAGGLYFQASGQIKLSRPKWGIGHNNKEWIKAVEDTDEQITAARTIFEKTAEGLKTDMASVKSYVADDGKRREQLEQYTRTETARSAEALRKQASESYVAKSQYSEDARGVARRFEELNLNGTNLLPNTDFKNLIDVGNQFTVGGKTYKVKTLDKWYSSYNDGIPNPKTNYHGFFNETKFSETVFEFNESNGVREWKGLPIFITNDSRYTVGKYIFSVDVNATGLGTHLEVGFYYYNKAGMREFHAGRSRKNITSINAWSRISLELKINDDVDFSKEIGFYIYGYGFTSNSVLYFKRSKLTNTNWTPSVEDSKKYTETKIAEYKQTVDGQFAAVKQDVNGKVSQATFEQRANQITQTVQELNDNVVKKNQIRVNENGIVSTAEKVVNGQTLASMIAQHPEWVEIIAKLLKVKADMIVNGAITADKLNVKELSALASDLGKITAGEIEFTARFRNSPSYDTWGTVPGEYNYDATVLINSSGIYSNGKIGRKNKEDKTPTITPVSYFKNGELFFANLEAGHSLKYMEMNGIHPFVRGGSSLMYFGKKEDGKDALYITCRNAELYLKSDNYTDWKQSEVNNKVRWKVQGSLVLVDFNLQFDRDGDYHLVDIPKQYVPSNKMFPVQAWSLDRNKDRTAQLNVGGDLHIIGAERGVPYLGQIIWTY